MNLTHLESVGISVFMAWVHFSPSVDVDLQACVLFLVSEQNSADGLEGTAECLNSGYPAWCKY